MRSFADVGTPARVRRLRRSVTEALPAFGIDARRVRVVHHFHNTTFAVEDHRGRRYAVRVYRPGWRTRRQIEGELAWLRALATDTELGAPRPVGGLVEIGSESVEPSHLVATFSWVPGVNLNVSSTPAGREHARRVGITAARLHAHTRSWTLPADFERPVCRGPGLTGTLAGLDALDPSHRELVELALGRCMPAFDRLDAAGSPFGLVHGDVHFGNMRLSPGRARPIDFDDSCVRHHAFDLAIAVEFLARWTRAEELTEALLEGYASVLPLPQRFEDELPHLRMARQIELGLWLASYRDDPVFGRSADRWISRVAARLESYAAGE